MKKKQRKIVTILCFFLCDKDTLVVFDKFFDGFYITQTTSDNVNFQNNYTK